MSATSLRPFLEIKYIALLVRHYLAVCVLLCAVTGPAVVDSRRYLASANSSLAQRLPQPDQGGKDTGGVDAARQLLLFLLGPTLATNKSIVDTFMPRVDPCQLSSPNTADAQGTPSPDLASGTCGPQPPFFVSYRYATSSNPVNMEPTQLPACSWSWLSCTDGRVVAVNLSCPGGPSTCSTVPLRGSLSILPFSFPSLVSLDLSGNANLTGSLVMASMAPEMQPYQGLKLLNLRGCGLTGSIPGNWRALPALEMLDLSGNRLTGIIPSAAFSDLHNLSVLSLANNDDLWGPVPSRWSELRQLKVLDLTGLCNLCGSTSTFTSLVIKLIQGSHVDQSCRLDECGNDSRTQNRLKGTFQGVMAALASVLGLIALYLMVRRMRYHADMRLAMRRAGGSYEDRERIRHITSEVAQLGPDGAGFRAHNRFNHCQAVVRVIPIFIVEFGVDADSDTWRCSVAGPSDLLLSRASVWLSHQRHAGEPIPTDGDGGPNEQQQERDFRSVLVAQEVAGSSRPDEHQEVAAPVADADSSSGGDNTQIAEVGGADRDSSSSSPTAPGGRSGVTIREVVLQQLLEEEEEVEASSGPGRSTGMSIQLAHVELSSELMSAGAADMMSIRHTLIHNGVGQQQGLISGVVTHLAARSSRHVRTRASMPGGDAADGVTQESSSTADGTTTQEGPSNTANSNVGHGGTAGMAAAPRLTAVRMMGFPEETATGAAAVVSTQRRRHHHDGLPKLAGMEQLQLGLHAQVPDAVVLMPDGMEVCLGRQVPCDDNIDINNNTNGEITSRGYVSDEEQRGSVEDRAPA